MNLLFFLVFSSALYNYGMGLQTVLLKRASFKLFLISCLQVFLELFLSLSISWLLIQKALVPLHFTKLFPLIVFLSFYLFHTILSFLAELLKYEASKEFFVPILILILTIFHSINYLNAIIIGFSCLLSYFLSIPILHAIEIRIAKPHPRPLIPSTALVLISIAIIMLSLYAFDLSWIFNGVF